MTTRPALTGQQADALAALIVSLRPGQRRWTKTAVYDALVEAGTKFTPDAETLIRAAIRAAITGSNVTPEVIAMRGAHWESVDDKPVPDGVRGKRCDKCQTFHTPACPCAGRPSERRGDYLAELRTIASAAKRPPDQTVERSRRHAEANPPGGET